VTCVRVSCDLEREEQLAEETTVLLKKYTLPDGRFIKVGEERFQAPEVLFHPVRPCPHIQPAFHFSKPMPLVQEEPGLAPLGISDFQPLFCTFFSSLFPPCL